MPIVYHLSPEYFTQFDPSKTGTLFDNASRRTGERGVFVAPNFRDALKWVGTVSLSKGHINRNKSKKQQRINREYDQDKRENPVGWNPDYQNKYRTLFLYKIEIPHDIMRKIKQHNRAFNKRMSDQGLWTNIGSWDAEIFIPEEYIPHMNIVGIKRYNTNDLLDQADHEALRPKSKGYEEQYSGQWGGRKAPPTDEEINQILDARKQFESQFNFGDVVEYEGDRFTIENINGREVSLKGRWRSKVVDILDFLSKATLAPAAEPNRRRWYNANRRLSLLRKIG